MFFKKQSPTSLKTYTCLTKEEINTLQLKAKASQSSFYESLRSSNENMTGNLKSNIKGAGIDFEENKPYQAGADSRHINWRTFARTGDLYVNIYNEDKRPSTYLVLDQRLNMYFGTRKQLKIKQALKFSTYAILKALYQQQAVSGVQISDIPTWHNKYNSENSILGFIDSINQPPKNLLKNNNNNEPALNDILNKLQLKPGSELIIISDLHDINQQTTTILHNLSQHYKISIVHIQDPIETNLPSKGLFSIRNNPSSQLLELNCYNNIMTSQYEERVLEKFKQHIDNFQQMGINVLQCTTLDKGIE